MAPHQQGRGIRTVSRHVSGHKKARSAGDPTALARVLAQAFHPAPGRSAEPTSCGGNIGIAAIMPAALKMRPGEWPLKNGLTALGLDFDFGFRLLRSFCGGGGEGGQGQKGGDNGLIGHEQNSPLPKI
jgi:hypothetical protein